MIRITIFACFIIGLLFVGCQSSKKNQIETASTNSVSEADSIQILDYENEEFAISYPSTWKCDKTNWNNNLKEVDFLAPKESQEDILWIHCVKSKQKAEWDSPRQAASISIYSHSKNKHCRGIVSKTDSLYIGGFPAYCICYLNIENGDSIINKQYIVLRDRTTIFYFNEFFTPDNAVAKQEIADAILGTIRFRKKQDSL